MFMIIFIEFRIDKCIDLAFTYIFGFQLKF